jgi:F-type H+-transporting ATPase subunit gamma
MATLKAIRRRIASVKSTQQITRAMKLVAAARLRRAQEALFSARPYFEETVKVAESVLGADEDARPRAETGAVLLMVIGSDRGLCGGYNSNLIRNAEEAARRLANEQKKVSFFAVGRKVFDHFRRSHVTLAGESINNTPRLATVELARKLSTRLFDGYSSGELRETSILYSRFYSALTQRPVFEQLLPIKPRETRREPQTPDESGSRAGGDQVRGAPANYLVEPSREELVTALLRRFVEASGFHALLEAEASEQGARMTAMDNATNNASEMIERLTLEMNRARQAAITTELMDIVGGAEALRSQSV